jgi:hypothetical protein
VVAVVDTSCNWTGKESEHCQQNISSSENNRGTRKIVPGKKNIVQAIR